MSPNELNTEKDIEMAFREAVECFPPPPELEQTIEARLGKLESHRVADKTAEHTPSPSGRKRTIMKVLKWSMPTAAACAAAALLILAVLPDSLSSRLPMRKWRKRLRTLKPLNGFIQSPRMAQWSNGRLGDHFGSSPNQPKDA